MQIRINTETDVILVSYIFWISFVGHMNTVYNVSCDKATWKFVYTLLFAKDKAFKWRNSLYLELTVNTH